MPFILLEIAIQALALADAIDPDPSEAPENRPDGASEMSDGRDDGFQRKPQLHCSRSPPGIKNRIDELRGDSRCSQTALARLTE
jgi:hypothetical protein